MSFSHACAFSPFVPCDSRDMQLRPGDNSFGLAVCESEAILPGHPFLRWEPDQETTQTNSTAA